jgi:hypothetical protein
MLSLIEQNGDELVETAAFTCGDPSLYGLHSIAAAASDGLAGHFMHNADLFLFTQPNSRMLKAP